MNPAINIAVTAQDGVTVKAYTLTVTRAAALSNNADLASLVPSAGTLAPSFASGIFNYTATVAKSALYYTVTPTVAQAGATVTVNGTAVTSGTASGHIPLSIGSNNVITIAVTAPAGGSPQIYTITVTRASVVPSRDWNGDAKPDLVFQNNAGQLYQWALDGTGNAITFSPKAGINSFAYLYTGGLGDWRVVGVADVNG
ncbi:MAG: cadherin-like beta sandwich domain-containing protein, partial [Verrucomicrobia bacterium]|nr:cadherin-like beta sandwich domain-containing protein [Verrucomicrobiota bacterium]